MKAIALILVLLTLAPCAYGWQHDLEARSELFDDNDGTHSLTLDQLFHWKDKSTKLGLGATQTLINESGGSRVFAGGLLEGYHKLDKVDFSAKLKLLSWNGELKTPLSLGSSQNLGAFRFEESVDYGTIDSVKAYDARISFWSVGGAVDWNVLKNLTVTGGYWRRWSSDDNSRNLFLGRASYNLSDNFLVQYRYRGIRNEQRVPQYYSPEFFDQHALLAGYADSFFDRLRIKFMAGPVVQDDGFETSVGALEDLRLFWRFNDRWSFTVHLEANQVGSGYQYLYSTVGLTRDF